MVVACLALAVALGGTGIAATVALAPNSVGTPQLKNNAVTTVKVKNGSLLKADFKAGQIPAGAAGPAGPAGAAGAAGAAGPAGPSDAYARFLNGPLVVPPAPATLANLAVPQAGKYVVFAKVFIAQSGGSATIACTLVAGTDSDESRVGLLAGQNGTLALNVVHEFAAAGSVDLQCATNAGATAASSIKMTAIKVGNLTNSG
jgi:hypothetical protein